MKKISTVFFILMMLFHAEALFASDSAYKNNLLKVEITKLNEDSYDIGLYTQKIYNEPVKIVKKSDTLYYLLLPETSHAVTSVPALGAVRNVTVKSYPYAGQDMKNGYTKVAIITGKPINISTSLKTLDASISPRLDPLRLARLDKAFERYSDRLAQGNVPTPLSEFRDKKPASAQKQTIASAQKPVTAAKPPVAKKPAAEQTAVKKPTQPVRIAESKPHVQASKPVILPKKAETKQQEVKETKPVKEEAKQEEVISQKPVETEFTDVPPKGPEEINSEVETEVNRPEKAVESKDIEVLPVGPEKKSSKNNLPLLSFLFVILLIAYIYVKSKSKKERAEIKKDANVQNSAGIKELLKSRVHTNNDVQEQERPSYTPYIENNVDIKEVDIKEPDFESLLSEETKEEITQEHQENENIEEETKEDIIHTEDDEVIRQLYTPIETPGAAYSNQNQSAVQNEDEAVIISSCKLTETRGLYLAKYDNTLALIGYIQDDIYVLYNFEGKEPADTKINSSLAMENDADIIYVVTVGDRKFMVKSAPFAMSLEAVV